MSPSRHIKIAKDTLYRFKAKGPVLPKFDNFLILDFEATCEQNKQITPQEIIEFPCLKVNSLSFLIVNKFHHYVQPKVHRELTTFCTDLTGITQEMVEDEPHFPEVFDKFNKWLDETRSFNYEENNIFVTSGSWDLASMIRRQCETSQIPVPEYFSSWIDIKKAVADATGYYPRGLVDMLTKLNLPVKGRLHSGIDDCYNIFTILKHLAVIGYQFKATDHISEHLSKVSVMDSSRFKQIVEKSERLSNVSNDRENIVQH